MANLLTSLTAGVAVSVALACQDDGMLIAERLPVGPRAEAPEVPIDVDLAAAEKSAVQKLLENNCGVCHGRSSTRLPHTLTREPVRGGDPPIADINDIDALVRRGLIVPGWPEASRLLYLMATEAMPPSSSGMPPVSEAELRRLEKFIVRLDPPSRTEVEQILRRHCGGCHVREQSSLPIDAIVDLEEMVAVGYIVPGDRDRSPLYTVILDEMMPPPRAKQPPVPNFDLARLGGYIDLME